jgi:hypothetical protein
MQLTGHAHGTTGRDSEKLSPSVARGLPISRKLTEGRQLFDEYRQRAREGHDCGALFDDVAEYDTLLRGYTGRGLAEARTLEIGFGARPQRQTILHSMGVEATGVDAEAPLLEGGLSEIATILRRNGVERAAKSLVRHLLFDRGERRALAAAIRARGLEPKLERARLIVQDAGELEVSAASLHLVFSEDVFEHIRRDTLERLIPRMATWLSDGGIALIRPNVFTGIVGGHLLEWSLDSMRMPPARRRSQPWEHLRGRHFAPNTYLNELTRADYRELFSRSFDILEERVRRPDLGREFFDACARRELAEWSEEELFSNQTLFVLRARR